MAERRMFSKQIVESDAFYDMPSDSQALYVHLCMNADDDGFVNNPQKIRRTMGASEDSLKILIAKRFVFAFENGVMVVKHWRMQNALRKDRYKPTEYTEEKGLLYMKPNGNYTFDEKQGVPLLSVTGFQDQNGTENMSEKGLATDWQPNGNQRLPQYSIGKDSIEEGNRVVGGKLNNTTTTARACADACAREGITVEQFEQELGCEGWEQYPNGDVYAKVRDTLIGLINDGTIPFWEVNRDLLSEIEGSMFKGRELREIVDLRAYTISIINRKRKERRGT